MIAASDNLMADTPDQNVDEAASAETAAAASAVEPAAVEMAAAPEPIATVEAPHALSRIEADLEELPAYSRRLLQIMVPVRVTLASQRKSIQEIVELGPGSIVKFDKTCDEPLDLCIGDRRVAQGEVVKVGDKFGLKVSGLVT
jgi:flagellar motor switch protein FliN